MVSITEFRCLAYCENYNWVTAGTAKECAVCGCFLNPVSVGIPEIPQPTILRLVTPVTYKYHAFASQVARGVRRAKYRDFGRHPQSFEFKQSLIWACHLCLCGCLSLPTIFCHFPRQHLLQSTKKTVPYSLPYFTSIRFRNFPRARMGNSEGMHKKIYFPLKIYSPKLPTGPS